MSKLTELNITDGDTVVFKIPNDLSSLYIGTFVNRACRKPYVYYIGSPTLKRGEYPLDEILIQQNIPNEQFTTENYTYMKVACDIAALSKCVSKKVACVLVREGRIISTGINGTSPGYENCCDKFDANDFDRAEHHEWANMYEHHAEQNAITFAARKGIDIGGSTAYCSLKPCIHCTKLLIAAGIVNIYYRNKYDMNKDDDALNDYLKANGVEINQIEGEQYTVCCGH